MAAPIGTAQTKLGCSRLVTLKNRAITPVARLFIEHAREVAKTLRKEKW
jgi:hypothetical protein